MAKYWVYINDQVQGPYAIDDLIRLRGFSRHTMVCEDDFSGQPTRWTSPAQIPELSPIFKVVEQIYDPSLPPTPAAPPPPKPMRKKGPLRITPVVYAPVEKGNGVWMWLVMAALVLGAGFWRWNEIHQAQVILDERASAKALLENYTLPSGSIYSSLRQYFGEKNIFPSWKYEQGQEGTQVVTVSWPSGSPGIPTSELPMYTVEANLQSQSLRGLNTAALRLLSEGFPPPTAQTAALAPHSKSISDLLPGAVDARRQAVNEGDYSTVWKYFSQQKRENMLKAGMSESGFERIQQLTHPADHPVTQTTLKTKKDSDKLAWVLVRESQSGQPELYIKQRWIAENGEWKLDDEEKRLTGQAASPNDSSVDSSAAASNTSPSSPPSAISLPGVSSAQ